MPEKVIWPDQVDCGGLVWTRVDSDVLLKIGWSRADGHPLADAVAPAAPNAATDECGGEAARSRHSGSVDDKNASGENRREEIGQRLAAIRARMDELKAVRPDDASAAAVRERIGSAQRQAAASQAAAEHAISASIRAFRRSARAHEHAALQHERAAATGFGDKDQHEQQAARHREAAVVDVQRAEHAQSLLGD